MTCPSPIALSIYADGELFGSDAAALERHLATCGACRARIEVLRDESVVLRAALRHADDLALIPRFAPPPRARDFVVLTLTVALIGGFSKAFWSTVAAAIPAELGWLSPLKSGTLFERAVDIVTFTFYEAPAMWTAITNFIGAALVLAFIAWLAFSAARPRAFAGIAASLLAAAFALPSTGHALELRRSNDAVTVAADETIDDTVFAMARTVSVDGTINGDLIALGQAVTVRGNVTGNLVTAAQTVTIEGAVGGTVIGAAEGLSLMNARIGRDLYGSGNQVDISAGTNVSGNVVTAADTVDLDGRVGIDFKVFGGTVNVSGAVEGDVEGYVDSIAVLSTARIGGNVTAHVDDEGDLDVSSGAVVGGNVDEQLVSREQRRNRNVPVRFCRPQYRRHFTQRAASRPRRRSRWRGTVGEKEPDRISGGQRNRCQSECDIDGLFPFRLRLLWERHGRGGVDHKPCGQQRTVLGEADVCAIAARQELPIELSRIVALAVQPIFGQLRRRAPQARPMRPRQCA